MIAICEECGKKYRIDPSKIRGRAASFKCRICSHVIVVQKPELPESRMEQFQIDTRGERAVGRAKAWAREQQMLERRTDETAMHAPGSLGNRKRRLRMGLRARMMLLFVLIPLLLIIAAGAAYLWQMETLTTNLTSQSSQFVNKLAEEKIADLAKAVAVQCKLYLTAHPEISKYDFDSDVGFKAIAVQPVGTTGYTAFYELPGSDNVWRTWAHVNPKIIGADMESLLKKPLGRNFEGFWKIYSGVKEKSESRGYYTWQDKDGGFREKFMVCIPVAGTRYVVAATTYMDEFTLPIKNLENKAREINLRSRYAAIVTILLTLLLILLVVYTYGHRLSGRIRTLTQAAERISTGDLDIEIASNSNDEIGELCEAISRMQESVRLSIERLHRLRKQDRVSTGDPVQPG